MNRIKALMEKRDKARAETKAIADKIEAEKRTSMSAEERSSVDKYLKEASDAQDELDLEVRTLELENRAASIKIERDLTEPESRNKITALMEKRAIAISTYGKAGDSQKLFQVPLSNSGLLDLITIEHGIPENMRFQLFSPNLTVVQATEAGSGSSASTTAYAPKTYTSLPYIAYVPVSDAFLKNDAMFEAKFRELFTRALFAQLCKELVAGDGSGDLDGVFHDTNITGANVTCAAAGDMKLVDILSGISALTGKFKRSQLAIVTNPKFISAAKAEDTYKVYFERKGDEYFVDGVRIVEDDNAPTTNTVGAPMAVVGAFSNVAIGISDEIKVELIGKVAGSLNNNMQGTCYLNGGVISPSSFIKIIGKASG